MIETMFRWHLAIFLASSAFLASSCVVGVVCAATVTEALSPNNASVTAAAMGDK
ncbi:MAG: hypothetical protein HC782_05330 [Gammaproteobacteria bacterium]|nr:hypothetical protein [Gammaproteobacteria bacterium]